MTRSNATTTPEAFLDVPLALERVQEKHPQALNVALADAANREFPGTGFGPDGKLTASACPDVFALSSFWAGVAACWHYMNAINGKDGGR